MSFSSSSIGNYSRTYLIILGAIFVVLGLGFAIALGGIPFAGPGMLLMGGIFAVVGGILIVVGVIVGKSASRTSQMLQTGIPGTATITGLTQTGVFLNDNPQLAMNLLVQLPGEVPYATNHKEFVPLMLLGRLSTGAPLSVRVDQMDRSKVAIDWSGADFAPGSSAAMFRPAGAAGAMSASAMSASAMAGGGQSAESMAAVQAALAASGVGGMAVAQPFATAAQSNYTVEQLRAWLRQSGVEASAHVDKLEDTGQTVGDERVFKMEMTLNIAGQASEKLPASAAMVPVAKAHKLFQGMNLPVRFAAQNHDLLMVEWDKI